MKLGRNSTVSYYIRIEPIENMQRLGTFLADDLQIGLPHVRADKRDLGNDRPPYDGKQPLKCFDRAG